MSLLIKALRKAEGSNTTTASGEDGPSQIEDTEPTLALPLDILDDDVHSLSTESGFAEIVSKSAQKKHNEQPAWRPAQNNSSTNFSQATANVFKTKEGLATINGASNQAVWVTVFGLVTFLLAGGAFYYYLDSLQRPTLVIAQHIPAEFSRAQSNTVESKQFQPATSPIPEPISQAVHAAVEIEVSSKTPMNSPPVRAIAAPEIPQDKGVTIDAVTPLPNPLPSTSKKFSKRKLPKIEKNLIWSTRNRTSAANTNTAAMYAYQAFMAGDDVTADRLYTQALQSDPRNVDVLLGLAAVAARRGGAEKAEQHYMQVLDIEPKSAAAQAGLIGLMGQTDPVKSESRLKSLLAQQPDTAFLHEALGNLYAEQGLWSPAQQTYFQAFHLEPANAEYAFNLAVSLDQLSKIELALNYYQHAQELQISHGGVLDKSELEKRIGQLRQALSK